MSKTDFAGRVGQRVIDDEQVEREAYIARIRSDSIDIVYPRRQVVNVTFETASRWMEHAKNCTEIAHPTPPSLNPCEKSASKSNPKRTGLMSAAKSWPR